MSLNPRMYDSKHLRPLCLLLFFDWYRLTFVSVVSLFATAALTTGEFPQWLRGVSSVNCVSAVSFFFHAVREFLLSTVTHES